MGVANTNRQFEVILGNSNHVIDRRAACLNLMQFLSVAVRAEELSSRAREGKFRLFELLADSLEGGELPISTEREIDQLNMMSDCLRFIAEAENQLNASDFCHMALAGEAAVFSLFADLLQQS